MESKAPMTLIELNRTDLLSDVEKKQVDTVDKLRKYKLYSIFCLWSPPPRSS